MTHKTPWTPGMWHRGYNDARAARAYDPPPITHHERKEYEAGWEYGRKGDADPRLASLAPEMAEALRALLEHEGERGVDGIGGEHDSDALKRAKESACAILSRLPKGE
jgi:hypothetical protein